MEPLVPILNAQVDGGVIVVTTKPLTFDEFTWLQNRIMQLPGVKSVRRLTSSQVTVHAEREAQYHNSLVQLAEYIQRHIAGETSAAVQLATGRPAKASQTGHVRLLGVKYQGVPTAELLAYHLDRLVYELEQTGPDVTVNVLARTATYFVLRANNIEEGLSFTLHCRAAGLVCNPPRRAKEPMTSGEFIAFTQEL